MPALSTALSRAGGVVASMFGRRTPGAAFMRGNTSPTFRGWNPALRDTRDDVRAAWRDGTARAVDAMQNSGWLAGAAQQSAASVVGTGLTLSAKPDMSVFGWDEKQTSEWARLVERRFELWANNPRACDARGKFKLGQLGAQAYRHWLATGEIVATLPWFAHQGSQFRTKIALKPSWQLSQKTEELSRLFQGVKLNAVGAPTAYLFKVKTPLGTEDERFLQAFDGAGRPLAMHIFDGEPDQVRGITPFVSILKVTRQFDQLADATLTAAIVQALFAAVFKSAGKPEDVIEALQVQSEGVQQQTNFENLLNAKGSWYDKTDINVGVNGRIAHLFPGDELQFLRSEHPNSTFGDFSKVLLRELSRPLAMSYAEFSGDWAGETYSSSRMQTAMIWPQVLYRRQNIVGPFHQTGYEAWLEEDIESGGTPLDGGAAAFLKNKDAICRADWRGPPKPQADDGKAAAAHETWKKLGVMTDEAICADLGTDVDDVYEQLKREKDRRAELGLGEAEFSGAAGRAVARDDDQRRRDREEQEEAADG